MRFCCEGSACPPPHPRLSRMLQPLETPPQNTACPPQTNKGLLPQLPNAGPPWHITHWAGIRTGHTDSLWGQQLWEKRVPCHPAAGMAERQMLGRLEMVPRPQAAWSCGQTIITTTGLSAYCQVSISTILLSLPPSFSTEQLRPREGQ